jgi:hypothetical protein
MRAVSFKNWRIEMRYETDSMSNAGSMFGVICALFFAAVLFSGLISPAGPIAQTQATQDISRPPAPAMN